MNESIYFVNKDNKNAIWYLYKTWKLNRIHQWIYIKKGEDEEVIIKTYFFQILAYIFKFCILSVSTGITIQPKNNIFYVRSSYQRIIKVGKFTIVSHKFLQNIWKEFIQQQSIIKWIYLPIKELSILENLICSKEKQYEKIIEYIAQNKNVIDFNVVNSIVKANPIFRKWAVLLSKIIDKLNWKGVVSTYTSIQIKHPFDLKRKELFENMLMYAKTFKPKKDIVITQETTKNFCFWESYYLFKHYWITFERAKEILLQNKPTEKEYEKIFLNYYNITKTLYSTFLSRAVKLENEESFKKILNVINTKIVWSDNVLVRTKERTDNDYQYVELENIIWTLDYWFLISEKLSPETRAIYLNYIIQECKPFEKYNTITGTILMNIVLLSNWFNPILIPSLLQNKYKESIKNIFKKYEFMNYFQFLEYCYNQTITIDFWTPIEQSKLLDENNFIWLNENQIKLIKRIQANYYF